jgi:curli biogenesis system outer membrane secretion channel CsgG
MKRLLFLLVLSLIPFQFIFAQSEPQSGYIISIEKDLIYLDLTASNTSLGNTFSVIEEGEFFTHPITGKKIKKKDKILASLEVTEVNDDYSVAKAYPASAVYFLKKGMKTHLLTKAESKKYSTLRKSISVHPLKVTSATGGYLGIYISDLLTENLFSKDQFKVIDRETLGLQMDELALKQDGISDSQVMGIGRTAGIDYLITGTMHEPDVVEMSTGIPLKGALSLAETLTGKNLGSKYVSDIKLKKLKAIVKLTLRIVDIRTGEIKFICTEMQQSEGKSDIALEQGFLGGLKVQGGSTAFVNTVTGQAVQKSLDNLSVYITDYFNGKITDRSFLGNHIELDKSDRKRKKKKKKKKKKEEIKLEFAIGDQVHFYDEYLSNTYNPDTQSRKSISNIRHGKIISVVAKKNKYQIKLPDNKTELIEYSKTYKFNPDVKYQRKIIQDKEFNQVVYHIGDTVITKTKKQLCIGTIKYLFPNKQLAQIKIDETNDTKIMSVKKVFPISHKKKLNFKSSSIPLGETCIIFTNQSYFFGTILSNMNKNGKIRIEYDYDDDGIIKSREKNIPQENVVGLKYI